MFTSLLVPLDGSARAEKAIDEAIPLARSTGGRVLLLRVVRPPEFFTKEEAVPPPPGMDSANEIALADYARRKDDAAQYLRNQLQSLINLGVPLEARVSESSQPADEILRVAAVWGADLIALTAHGAGGSSRVGSSGLFGSVCDAVLRHAELPVLVVKRGAKIEVEAKSRSHSKDGLTGLSSG